MANHPKYAEWQRAIQLLKARDATEPAPADVKKDVGDKLKLLDSAVTKFNTCFDDVDKRQGILEDVHADAVNAHKVLVDQFDEAQDDSAATIKTAIQNVDDDIDKLGLKPGELRGDVLPAEPPTTVTKIDPSQFKTQKQAEEARDNSRNTLADVERKLKEVETFCAEVPKWEGDLAKALRAAKDTSPVDNPVDAWTNIKKLETWNEKFGGLLDNDVEKRAALSEKAKAISNLIGVQNGKLTGILVTLLWNYRAAAARAEALKQDASNADTAWKAAQASRRENILLEIENPRPVPPPLNPPAAEPEPAIN